MAEGFIDMKRRRGGKGVPSGNLASSSKFCDTSDNWPTNPKILGKESIVGHKRESKNRSLKFLILPLILSEEKKYFFLQKLSMSFLTNNLVLKKGINFLTY